MSLEKLPGVRLIAFDVDGVFTDGRFTLSDAGVESTLASDNRLVSQKVELRMDDLEAARYASLFDPQTSGGLLFGVVEDSAEQVLQFLRNEGFGDSAIIGQVTNCNLEKPVLSIV